MDIGAAEAQEFAELIDGPLRLYETLDALPDDLPPVHYPRTPGSRPDPADNPYKRLVLANAYPRSSPGSVERPARGL